MRHDNQRDEGPANLQYTTFGVEDPSVAALHERPVSYRSLPETYREVFAHE